MPSIYTVIKDNLKGIVTTTDSIEELRVICHMLLNQHIDDTGAKVNGEQNYMPILCNQFYTAYFTHPDKSKLTILEILSSGNVAFQLSRRTWCQSSSTQARYQLPHQK